MELQELQQMTYSGKTCASAAQSKDSLHHCSKCASRTWSTASLRSRNACLAKKKLSPLENQIGASFAVTSGKVVKWPRDGTTVYFGRTLARFAPLYAFSGSYSLPYNPSHALDLITSSSETLLSNGAVAEPILQKAAAVQKLQDVYIRLRRACCRYGNVRKPKGAQMSTHPVKIVGKEPAPQPQQN